MDEVPDLEGDTLKLVIVKAGRYHETIQGIVRKLVKEKKHRGVYVTLNRSCCRLEDIFSREGIPTDNIFFVDAVSRITGSCSEEKVNHSFVADPHNLSGLNISIFRSLEGLGEENRRFLILDCLSSLLIYNKSQQISRFLHSFTAEIRPWNLNGVIVSIEGEFKPDAVRTFSGFCDEVIEIG